MLAHEKAVKLSGVAEQDYEKLKVVEPLRLASSPDDTWFSPKAMLAGTTTGMDAFDLDPAYVGAGDADCPQDLIFTRAEKGWLYSLDRGWKRDFSKDEVENCILRSIRLLAKLGDELHQGERTELDGTPSTLGTNSGNGSSWN